MEHTPGPWEAGKAYKQDENQYYSVIFSPAKTETFHTPRAAEALGVTQKEAEANARLISAAPDLLKELERMVMYYEPGESRAEALYKIKHAQEAIERATGN